MALLDFSAVLGREGGEFSPRNFLERGARGCTPRIARGAESLWAS